MLLQCLLKRTSGLLIMLLLANSALADHRQGHVDVRLPALSEMGSAGQLQFNQSCASCHGENGSGTMQGPSLIHAIYNPGHHSDKSIFSAIHNGVRQHHWPYGDMPKQPGVGFYEASAIVKFIREVQQANGITLQQH
ncbi:c-type cytochrome [Oceanobacter mangrovi]|uniref:c-type cytochrome n=1 Tax=Oceanobacter mangrovi TaxID=2862510 RepID=UPI001C8F0300|nr:c-type cytochrome [Oceanobacter mangrovi]